MKHLSAFVLFTTCLVSPLWAADQALSTHVDAITVYPEGADVWRTGSATMQPGETRLLISDLPGTVDPQSIRVEAVGDDGLFINGIDTKLADLPSTAADEKRKTLDKKLQGLADEKQALDQLIGDAQAQKTLLLSLANKQLTPTTTTETLKPIDAAGLDGLVSLVGSKLSAISKSIHDAELRKRDIDQQSADINLELEALSPDAQQKLEVAVNVSTTSGGEGQFRIKYRISEAGWLPFYDAKLTLPDKVKPATVSLVRRAEVHQSTTENWSNVALTLSTARPNGATSAPELNEDAVALADVRGRLQKSEAGNAAKSADMEMDTPALAEAPAPMDALRRDKAKKDVAQAQAQVFVAGFNAQYAIAGRVDIDNSGQSKKVRIASEGVTAKLEDVAVPRLDPTAYLTAAFHLSGADPVLPGVVNLYRDDAYVGQGALPMLAPGEEARLGFGVDDLVKVKRVEVKRNAGEEGLISTSFTKTLAWDISAKNLHDTPFDVVIVDRVPFSTQDQVTVQTISDFTPATTENYMLKRGVKAWSLALDLKQEKVIKIGYKISAPKNIPLALTE
jgi:uncharacterized protein (TIGR02231 family)